MDDKELDNQDIENLENPAEEPEVLKTDIGTVRLQKL